MSGGRSTVLSPSSSECHAPHSQASIVDALEAVDGGDELGLEGLAAELAVGDDLAARVLLEAQDVEDGAVLDRLEGAAGRARRAA